jgi:hypothetical protein
VKDSTQVPRTGGWALWLSALVLAITAPGLATAQSFSGVINVSQTNGNSRQPHIVVSPAGVVHVAWSDDPTNSQGQYRILYRRSFDNGQSFSSPVTISTGTGAALRPKMALSGDRVYMVWMQDPDTAQESNTKEIMFSRSLNGGASFSAPVNLSNTPGHSQEARIAVDSAGTIHVVWDEASPSRHVAIRRSFDGGASFDGQRSVAGVKMGPCPPGSIPSFCTTYPGVATDLSTGAVYVTWHDFVVAGSGNPQVFFSRSLDGGNNFSAAKNISNAPIHAHCAAITVGPSGRILIAYEQIKQVNPHTHNAMFVQSTDGGTSFSTPKNLSNTPSWAISDYPWPAEAPNGAIVVGWEDNSAGGEPDAVYAISTDGGLSFSGLVDLSNNPAGVSTEVVTVFGGDGFLYVVWEDHGNGNESSNGEILMRRAAGFGGTPGPPPPPPPPPPPGGGLSLAVRGIDNGIYVNRFNGAAWLGWTQLPGATLDSPALAVNGNMLELVVHGSDNAIYHNRFDGASWLGWVQIPIAAADAPALLAHDGMLELVVRGVDNGIYHNRFNGAWGGWTRLGGQATSAPALAGNGLTELVIRGLDNSIYHNRFDGTQWLGWFRLEGATLDSPTVAANGQFLELAVRGIDDGIYHNRFDGANWLGWTKLEGATSATPALTATGGGGLEMVVRGIDDGVYANRFDGQSWLGWTSLSGSTGDAPAAAANGGTVHLLLRGTDNAIYHSRLDEASSSWLGFSTVEGATAGHPAVAPY